MRVLHFCWALPCLASSVFLAQADGHPPGIIFVPVVLVVWLMGHAMLSLTRRLSERGRARSMQSGSWPPGIIAVAVGAGVASFLGIMAMAWPFLGGAGLSRSLLPFVAAAWALHAVTFVGLLLRTTWARRLGSALAAGWAILLSYQVIEHLLRGRPAEPLELVGAIIVALLLFGLAVNLMVGKGPSGFTAPSEIAPQ